MLDKKTVSIGIPAYNEERNIGELLKSLLKQKSNNEVKIEQILVISDGSKDNTGKIVKNFDKRHKIIKSIVNTENKGKSEIINEIILHVKTDYLVLFDADIKVFDDQVIVKLVRNFINEKIGLVGGLPVPIDTDGNYVERASIFSFKVQRTIKKRLNKGDNVYSCHGRILCLSKGFYSKLKMPKNIPGTDAYIYFSCKKIGLDFVYDSESRVYYKTPSLKKDFIKQNRRFSRSRKVMKTIFHQSGEEYSIPKLLVLDIILKEMILNPYNFFCWFLLILISSKTSDKEIQGCWGVLESTK